MNNVKVVRGRPGSREVSLHFENGTSLSTRPEAPGEVVLSYVAEGCVVGEGLIRDDDGLNVLLKSLLAQEVGHKLQLALINQMGANRGGLMAVEGASIDQGSMHS